MPETTDLTQAAIGAVLVIVVAYAYARSRFGRLLRATREDAAAARAVGISIYRQRLGAFVLSGVLAGFAGGLYIHLLPLRTDGAVSRSHVHHAGDAGHRRRRTASGARSSGRSR